MGNKTTWRAIMSMLVLALLSVGLRYTANNVALANMLFNLSISIVQILALMLLTKNGTLITSKYMRFIALFFLVSIVGMGFKVLHLAYAEWLFLLGAIGITITYFIHFMAKSAKHILDVFKLLWAITGIMGIVLILLKMIPAYYMWISTAVLLICLLLFRLEERRQAKTELESQENNPDNPQNN